MVDYAAGSFRSLTMNLEPIKEQELISVYSDLFRNNTDSDRCVGSFRPQFKILSYPFRS